MSWTHSITPDSRALVTGATSGIGAATVRALAEQGCRVLAVGRREAELAKLAAATRCETLAADIRDIDRVSASASAFEPTILVNNAGVGHGIAGMAGLANETIREAIEVNVVAPILLSAAVLEGMKQRGGGHIVNIGSIAGLHTLISAVYGAGKAAVHRFSQNLRHELRGTGIRVTEICPGRVASEFYQAAAGGRESLAAMGASGIRDLSPEDVAETILFALRAPAHVNIATIEILPTEQTVGGVSMTPVRGGGG